jgi:hypothetical protein
VLNDWEFYFQVVDTLLFVGSVGLRVRLMSKKNNPTKLLFDLARDKGPDVVHLPYSSEFEAFCNKITPKATTEDKHSIWERLIDGRDVELVSTGQAEPAQIQSSSTLQPVPFALSTPLLARSARPQEKNGLLFELDSPVSDLQPWSVSDGPKLLPEQEERRQKMLADLADSHLATREQKVACILQKFPETRDSDTALCIRYWKKFQADVLERWRPLELEVLFGLDRIETIGRVRRIIQNDLGLFRGVEEIRRGRDAMQAEFHEYLAAHRGSFPEIRFYLDETGNEGDKAFMGIAGICVLNWKQFEKHHAAIELWRSKQGWPETIHFSETGADKIDRAVALLRQLQSRRSGVLFLGYSLRSQGRTSNDLLTLFIQLVVDSLKHLHKCGCPIENRSIRVIKEADHGFDTFYLPKMNKELSEMVAQEFPEMLTVLPVEAVTKGRSVLLECADLIAGGMQRRVLFKGHNPKDRLAETIINVTGLEDSTDAGTIFKYFAATR